MVITLSLTSFPSCELITSLLGDFCLNPWCLHSFCASVKGKHVQGEWKVASKKHMKTDLFLQYCETLKLLNLLKKANQMFTLCRYYGNFTSSLTVRLMWHLNISTSFPVFFFNCLCNHVQPLKALHSEHKVTTKQQALIPKCKEASNMDLQQTS